MDKNSVFYFLSCGIYSAFQAQKNYMCVCTRVREYATVIFIFCVLVIKNKVSVKTKHVLDQPVIVIYLARCHLLANSYELWVLVIKNNTLKLWNVPRSGNSG